jgi:hypothetical protein
MQQRVHFAYIDQRSVRLLTVPLMVSTKLEVHHLEYRSQGAKTPKRI